LTAILQRTCSLFATTAATAIFIAPLNRIDHIPDAGKMVPLDRAPVQAPPVSAGIAPTQVPPLIVDSLASAALRYDLPLDLLTRRAWQESRFDPNADDGRGCLGIMQLNVRFFPDAAEMTTAENIDAGARYLAQLLRQCDGDRRCAERAYRTGKVRKRP
jgi:soluble lytic murein transglycosylase-like protein